MKLASLDVLWLRVPVYSGDWGRLDRAAPASVQTLGDTSTPAISAKPIPNPPTADAPASTRDLYYELKNPGALRPGERVSVTLPLAGAASRLTVARSSVVYDINGGAWVYQSVSPT